MPGVLLRGVVSGLQASMLGGGELVGPGIEPGSVTRALRHALHSFTPPLALGPQDWLLNEYPAKSARKLTPVGEAVGLRPHAGQRLELFQGEESDSGARILACGCWPEPLPHGLGEAGFRTQTVLVPARLPRNLRGLSFLCDPVSSCGGFRGGKGVNPRPQRRDVRPGERSFTLCSPSLGAPRLPACKRERKRQRVRAGSLGQQAWSPAALSKHRQPLVDLLCKSGV